ncbi:MATH domain and coiled-coil domain-containing protein [Cardamine amara subsp. amara]|uniref:MATH domain and coiled-coil domain-containing protein n=1 Tax=Cardamine amara subsp. amara TaxID=228776 RepID=A0ABD1BEU9_CARAN
MWNQKPGFRFEIDNFSEKKDAIVSYPFVSGGCEWFLYVYPKGEYSKKLKREYLCDDHLSLFIHANSSLLQPGWKRSVNFYFSVLNQSNKELYRTPFVLTELSGKRTSWGFRKTFPLTKIQEKGFLEEDRLIIEVYINVSEAFDGESGDVSEKKEAYINGFRVFASQVTSVRKIFAEHPDIATYVKPKNQVVRTEYMNVLLGLINTLNKPSENISVNELGTGLSELSELTQAGFNLDWLKIKLVRVSLERITLNVDGFRIQEVEERLNKLEKMESNLKLDSLKRKLDEVDSERKKAKANEPRVQKLEERVKNIELMESGFMMDSLKSKLDDVSLEKKKSYYADGSRVQELEESVKDLKKMVSDLKNKLDKEEAKSSDDEFLLVNEVA